ncbi:hypothetical protein TNCV_3616801 [Trichonephila clavipes]|nr:hypothetical protein TNCV_3616801 [Trichonephila clavipes]
MGNPGHCGSYPDALGDSRGGFARFCLTIGHKFLEVYLNWWLQTSLTVNKTEDSLAKMSAWNSLGLPALLALVIS